MDVITNHWIPSQFPSFYNSQGPNFISFIKAYYEFLETTNNPLYYSRNFLSFHDIDTTLTQFIQYFKDQFMADLPNTMIADQRLLIKHILDLYRSKGTKRGYELLFRILFNEDIRLYIPSQYIFKPSDNTWVKNSYIEVSSSPYNPQLVGLSIFSSSNEASALVEDFNILNINNKTVNVLTLSNVVGNFKYGSFVLSEDLPILNTISAVNTIIENINPAAAYFNWTQSLPLTFSANGYGPYRGTETRQFAWSNGSLYAAIGDWTDPDLNSNSNPGPQILRLDSPTSTWTSEVIFNELLENGNKNYLAIGSLFATEFTIDYLGNSISPVEYMVASMWSNGDGLDIFQRIGGTGNSWNKVELVNANNAFNSLGAQVRSFKSYVDSNTGIQILFGGTNPFGIYTATYNANTANVVWSSTPELGSNNVSNTGAQGEASRDRVMSFCNSSNALFASIYDCLVYRTDGESPFWTKFYEHDTTLPSGSSGIRALTLTKNTSGNGNMMVYSLENDPATIWNLQLVPPYTVEKEFEISTFLTTQLNTSVGYGIAGYNDMLPYPAEDGTTDLLIGLSAAAPNFINAYGETYPAAMYLVRHVAGTYELRTISDPSINPSPPLEAVRTMTVSQFAGDANGTLYAGGFDAGYGRIESYNTNWIYKGIINSNISVTQYIIPDVPMVIGSLSAISISEGGENFNIGDIINVSGSGSAALARVSSITNENGEVTFTLLNGGAGFSLNAIVEIIGGSGTGASFSIGKITNQQTYQVDTDVINTYYNVQMDNSNSGFTLNISNTNGTFTVGEVINSTANGIALDFTYVSGNSLSNTEILSNTSLGIANLEIIEIDNPNFINLTGPQSQLINANLISGVLLVGATSGDVISINSILPLANYKANGTITAANSTVISVNNCNSYFLPTSIIFGQSSGANGFLNSIKRDTNWGFPVVANTNLDSEIENVFSYETIIGGTIATLINENPGNNYSSNPTITITEPSILQLQIPDGDGGYLGGDANVIGAAAASRGIISAVDVIDSGYGFIPGESLNLSGNGPVIGIGSAIVDGTGISQGYWLNNKSFLSSDQALQDSYYYQKFSYEIQAPRMLATYQQFITDLVHPVQMLLFGRFYFTDEQQANSQLISQTMVQT